ncbi:Protein of unknown function DUF58 [Flexibacter flexilis DSM 6793]|uniref:DUF58 domain-containing protein n=1 Tax=Flexibacter flexilis DSM 6793 TaxID=927664 RepID=A0A1I1H938_9BACT|nr:DUF58 domain-containing protein [Flexibacter flexilis]SFC20225.1 Protein of unknown function DUF58 [Flexibacter flexilis DSM 6793]
MKLDLAKVRQFGNIEFLARQMVEGFITGLHKSPYHGFSVEFAEHKIYNPGEGTRHIDWKVYAKTDRLYTKRYEEETNLRCRILIDVSSSMYYPVETQGKITFSIAAAAALTYMLQKQRDAVGISTFAQEMEWQTSIKSTPSHVHKLFLGLQNLLERKPEYQKTSVAPVLHQIADSVHRRSLIVIFSDMFDEGNTEEIFAALQHLKHNRHEVLLFHVTDRATEQLFEFEERPYEFLDLESGEKLKIKPSQVQDHYKEAIGQFSQDLKLRCGQYKIDFIEADIRNGIDGILLPYLVKRSKMS